VIVLGDRGLIVQGPSGSGKTRLCHLLVDGWQNQNRYARWVADDRFLLTQIGDQLIASSPSTIAGLAERRFRGIEQVDWQARAVVDLVIQLVDGGNLERLPVSNQHWQADSGVSLPLISVPGSSLELAIELIEAQLSENKSTEPIQTA
jgi:serine kinase of HPr protein (carbohydrate metabolism regulator)